MVDLSKCDHVIETYTDEYRTLSQSIMYRYNDIRERDYLRTTINPNLTRLISVRYFDDEYNLLFEEKHKIKEVI